MPADILLSAGLFPTKIIYFVIQKMELRIEGLCYCLSMEWRSLVVILELTVIANIFILMGWHNIICSKELCLNLNL